MAAIEINNLRFSYNGTPVLNSVSLDVPEGRMVGILGPNGSGKTTLARCVTGALRPEKGSVRIMGTPLERYTERRLARVLSVVPQRSHIDFDFSVREIVLMGRYPYTSNFSDGDADAAAIAHDAMERTGVLNIAERSVTRVSGGEFQRVLLARALCQSTPIMLLDEPVSNLDIRYQIDALRLLQELVKQRGLTVVCVLHDLNLAARFCDSIALLNKGAVAAYGTPEGVLTRERLREVYGVEISPIIDADTGVRVLVPQF